MIVSIVLTLVLGIMIHLAISHFKGDMDWPSFLFSTASSILIRDVFPNRNLTNLHEVRDFLEGLASSTICQEFKDLAKLRCPSNGNKNSKTERDVMEEAVEWHPNLLPLVSKVVDHTISNRLSIRIYYPYIEENVMKKEGIASLLWLHGGGFVLGSVDADDRKAAILANQTEVVAVVSVAYSLAPESPHPAAVNDAYEALNWLLYSSEAFSKFHLRADRVFIGGESAGGTLAAATVAMKEEIDIGKKPEEKIALKGMLLIYPPLAMNFTTDSYFEHANVNKALSATQMEWFWDLYDGYDSSSIGNNDRSSSHYCNNFDYKLCPMLTPSHVLQGNRHWPLTWVHLAKYDVLYSEGKAYADRLLSFGHNVQVFEYSHTVHGFFFENIFPESKGAIQVAVSSILDALRQEEED